LKLLELRFDNVIYRLGFASSRPEARQLVVHGHFTVNGKKADIPSMSLKIGDVIQIKEKSQSSEKFKTLIENHKKTAPQWLQVEPDNFTGRLIADPTKADIEIPIEEHLIVELYSR
jgi:small subunit ribosomal protein S4